MTIDGYSMQSTLASYQIEEVAEIQPAPVIPADMRLIPPGCDEDGGRVLFLDRGAIRRRRFAPKSLAR
jgi:hypothetical protein